MAEFLTEETMKLLLAYITANFGPDDPVPQIPPELVVGGPAESAL